MTRSARRIALETEARTLGVTGAISKFKIGELELAIRHQKEWNEAVAEADSIETAQILADSDTMQAIWEGESELEAMTAEMNRTAALEELNDLEEQEIIAGLASGDLDVATLEKMIEIEPATGDLAERMLKALDNAVSDLKSFGQSKPANRAERRQEARKQRLRGDGQKRGTRKAH